MLITSNSTSPANSRATGLVAPVLRRLGPSSYLESEISGPGGDGAMPRSARERRSQSRGRDPGTPSLKARGQTLGQIVWEASRPWPGSPSAGRPWSPGGRRDFLGKRVRKKRGSQLNPFLCKDSRPPGEVLELVWLGVQCWVGLVLRV